MAITAHRYRRVEIWDKWQAAGGVRQIVVPDVVGLNVIANTLGTDKLTMTLPTNSPAASSVVQNAIVRIDQDDSTFDEWKIVEGPDDDDITGMRSVVGAPVRSTDLMSCDIVRRIDSDGTNVPDFESVGLTPALHISTWIVPALTRAGIAWIVAGTITPTMLLDMTYAWDSPLSALTRIAEACGMELDVRRVGTTQYAIDIIPAIGSSAPVADVRLGRNLVNLRRTRTALDQGTRVFPRGATENGVHATMARAQWGIVTTAGAVITLQDPAGGAGPIKFDGQLVGMYLREPQGVLRQVTASSASAQTVTLASSISGYVAVGDLIQFRADSAGADLLYLDSPTDQTSYGIKAAPLDVPDVPSTNNIVKNSVMRAWPGSSSAPPTNWTAVGTPTIAKQTAAPYIRIGPNSIHVTATSDGQGVISDAIPIFPTALKPYISGFASVWGVAGQFRVELVFTIPGGNLAEPILPDVASNTVNGQWVDLGVSGIDANAIGATAVQIRIVQHGSVAANFYVDAGQITSSATQAPFAEVSGGTRLWQAANERLRMNGAPLLTYDVPLIDLAAVNPGLWASDTQLAVGGIVRVTDSRLGVAISTRLIELRRDYRVPGATVVVLSNKPDDITGTLARPPRPARQNIPDGATAGAPAIPEITYLPDTNGNVSVAVSVSNDTRTIRAVANVNSTMPTGVQVNAASGTAIPAGSATAALGNLLTGLVTGDRYNIAVRAYNAYGVPSDLAMISDVYISGVVGAQPAVVIGTPVASTTAITFPITPNRHTTNFEVYVKEYNVDPGALVDVDGAYATPYDDIVVGPIPARVQVGGTYNLTIPLGAGANYLMITIVPYNAYLVGTKARAKATGGGASAGPLPPTTSANVSKTAVQIVNSVTMPSPVPGFIVMYRDNINIGMVAVTAIAGAVQNLPADTGLTPSTAYSYTYAGYSGGVESSTRTTPLVVTTNAPGGGSGQIPTPTIAVSYVNVDESFNIEITPADGTPGVYWHVEKSYVTGGPYTELSNSPFASTHATNYDPRTATLATGWFRAWGTKTGYTDSARSTEQHANRPRISDPDPF